MWKRRTAFVAALLCAAPLSAQVVRLEISSREVMTAGAPAGSPAFIGSREVISSLTTCADRGAAQRSAATNAVPHFHMVKSLP